MKRLSRALILMTLPILLGGCFMTKVVTVPMRVTGAVVSVVPVVGNTVDGAIDVAADGVDLIPL